MKKCIICWQTKAYNEYYKHPGTKDGYLTKCKECQKENTRYNQTPEKDKKRYSKNPIRRLQTIYRGMIKRCTDPNNNRYHCYGMLGIRVERSTRKEFVNDMLESYVNHYKYHKNRGTKRMTQIDRIDVNGNYCKENCKRSTPKQQANNRR